MSTDNKKEINTARRNLEVSRIRIIRRAKKKRITRQIRIPAYLHEKISKQAQEEGITMSKVMEDIGRWFYRASKAL